MILCEGKVDPIPDGSKLRKSPGSYRQQEFDDSKFYRKCLPRYLQREYCPQFFNCGSQASVIKVFHQLLEIHNLDPSNSNLSTDKLFSLVDLDLGRQPVNKYVFPDIESIYRNIYHSDFEKLNLSGHQIYTTGLIHKEAYFILPELEREVFNEFLEKFPKLQHSGQPFNLKVIYQTLIHSIGDDPRIRENFGIVKQRIQRYLSPEELIDLDPRMLQVILEQRFEACTNQHSLDSEEGRSLLIKAVLVITKVKDLAWNQITDGDDYPLDAKVIRDQLTLNIAEYFSRNHESLRDFHIMEILKFIAEQSRS
ncbi:hypothetical protein BCR12_04730 [Limnothrix sp. P13C2]|nr:hypothetical protein BCR12_04730 [Limnothrix sp. P13C2]